MQQCQETRPTDYEVQNRKCYCVLSAKHHLASDTPDLSENFSALWIPSPNQPLGCAAHKQSLIASQEISLIQIAHAMPSPIFRDLGKTVSAFSLHAGVTDILSNPYVML